MATSPTPSLESLPGANSIGSFGEHNDYLSDSPLTLSGSSPPVSDSAICDDFSGATSSLESHHQTNSSASSSSASSTSSSGIGGGGGGGGGGSSGSGGGPGGGIITTSTGTRCTGCKSKQSDAVAKCIDCVNYLCSNCVTAHQFMHCFDGHSVFRINAFDNTITSPLNGGGGNCLSDMQNNPISFLMQPQTPQPQSQLSKLMMNGFDSQSQQSRFSLKDDPISKLSISSLLNGGGPPSSNGSNDILAVASAVTSTASANNNSTNAGNKQTSQYFCTRHKNELLKFFCRTCTVPVCKDCIVMDHPAGLHECEHVQDATPKQIDSLLQIIAEVRSKAADMRQLIKNSEHNSARLQVQYHKAQNEINETYQFFRSMLDERKQELFKELENFFNAKTMSHSVLMAKTQEHVEKVLQSCDCVERVSKHAGLTDALMLRKLMENRLQSFVQYGQELQSTCELDFVSNYQAIQVGVRNTFGYIRSSADTPTAKQPPIARPTNNNMLGSGNNSNGGSNGSLNGPLSVGSGLLGGGGNNPCPSSVLERSFASVATSGSANVLGNQQNSFDSNIISKRFNSVNSLGPFVSDVNLQVNPYEKWSNGGSDNVFNGLSDQYTLPIGTAPGVGVNSNVNSSSGQGDSMIDLTSKLLSTTIFPPKSQIKRQKMIYHCKFGEFGVMEGQFTEPSGVAVNAQNDIIVADTNNHRIQIFDKEGRFKFQFGECGKRDGQLLYPNRVAVVRNSGDIIVTERSPTHQIQIYNQYGQFVRKFGANILQHPRGVTVDNKGRIIVVECKVMRVIIFDQSGNVLQKFGCSKHLEFPNGVVVNDKQEIFISDNRAHCVKVFNYEGTYLRQIGGEGITNYPIGVGINAAGEILIADNHNNFNLTIFTQDGQLVSALESKVKHAQCFDVALMDDGSVVLASKDYRLYIYRYVQEKQKCSLEEFAIFFLNFIRTQTDGFLRGSTASMCSTPRRNPHLGSGKNSKVLDISFVEVSETSFPALPGTPQQQQQQQHPQQPQQQPQIPKPEVIHTAEKSATKNNKNRVQTIFSPLRTDNARKNVEDEPQVVKTPPCKKENRISSSRSPSCSLTEGTGESGPFVTPGKNRSFDVRFSSNTSTPVAKWPDRLNYSLTPSKPSSPGGGTTIPSPVGQGGKSKNGSKDKGKSPASICLGDFLVAAPSHKRRSGNHSSQADSGIKSSKCQEVKKSIRRIVPTPAPAPHDGDLFGMVTSKGTLDKFVEIHSALIDLNLTTNILTEVSYLLNLLNIEDELFGGGCSLEGASKVQNNQIDSKSSREYCKILKRPPNCIYFALKVLEKQKYLLALLDVTTLRVVLDNDRLEGHCKELKEFLGGIYNYKLHLEGVKSNHEASFRIGQNFTNVFYQEENDTRSHFPSDREFAAFRKQRDMFYTILKAWETRHLKPTFNFAAELGAKVNSIFATMDHPINMAHLSKLFTSQLIISSNFSETPSELEIASLNIDKDKLAKLRQRLVAPSDFSTDYQFPGKQAFFKDFLLVAQSMSFIEQMKLALIAELMERNGSFYEIISLSFTMDDKKLYNEYVVRPEIIATMRVLGKFLGLIIARPFMYEGPRSAEVDNKQIELRNMMRPSFDVMGILKKSLSERKLLVTIPWLVQYVSMLDPVTLCLTYYRELINLLYEIYLNLNKKNACSQFQMRPTSVFILRCCLGWLFDRPHVFDDFYTYRQNREIASDSLTDGIRELSRILQKSSDGIKVEEKTVTKQILLDASEPASESEQPIDVAILKTSFDPLLESVLNVACPFLADFRVAIMPSKLAKSTSRDGRCRKITPIAFEATTPVRSNDHDPQTKLTEAFLHSQTMSVRRIVEFVTERTTSAAVKDFQVEVLLPARDEALQKISAKDENGKILQKIDAITEAYAQTMQKWNDELEGKIEGRVKMALEALLPHETPEAVKNTCALIVIKKCKVKAEEWRIANLSGLDFFSKDVSKAENEATVLKICNLEKALPSEIFHRLHYLLYITYARPDLVNQKNIFQFCSDCLECVQVQKLPASARKVANSMLVYLAQNLIKTHPDIFSDELEQNFINIWLCDKMKEFVGILDEQEEDDDSQSGDEKKEEKVENTEDEKKENKDDGKEESEEDGKKESDENERKENKEDENKKRSLTYSIFDELVEVPFIRSLASNPKCYDRLTHFLTSLINSGMLTINYLNEKFVALFKQEWPEDIFKNISMVLENISKHTAQQSNDEEKSHLFMEMLADLARDMEDF